MLSVINRTFFSILPFVFYVILFNAFNNKFYLTIGNVINSDFFWLENAWHSFALVLNFNNFVGFVNSID